MSVQHADIFHCLCCGRVIYEPHGTPAPTCCRQPMVRAVSDVVTDVPPPLFVDGVQAAETQENALLAEAVELGNWCHTIEDIDVSRYQELAEKLRELHAALLDRFDLVEQQNKSAHFAAAAESKRSEVERLRAEHRQILVELELFVADLKQGESSFRGWAEVCERLDALVADFRRNEDAQNALALRPRAQD